MPKEELERRTRAFALQVLALTSAVKRSPASDVLVRQVTRSATSVGANYREANRAESRQDFIHKIALVEKEASETCYRLELLEGSGLSASPSLADVRQEANELLAIFTSIGKRTKNPGTKEGPSDYAE